MTVTVAYRRRGSAVWTHHFRVRASEWRTFRAHARLMRSQGTYALVRHGVYTPVLA
jgi:hypothetical protein